MCTLTVVIPCFNEQRTLDRSVARVRAVETKDVRLEILIVDDGSSDESWAIASTLAGRHPNVQAFRHEQNQGKGAAIRTGIQKATGDFVAVQDADLEYDPRDLIRLVEPLASGQADVVLGSRFLSAGAHRVLYFWHSLGNRLLTLLSNMFTDLNLTDMETCYKVFRREVIQKVSLEEDRFGFEPEVVAKVAHMRLRIYEMGIDYHGRTYEEGKKIGWRDGVRALYCIFKYNAPKAPLPMQLALYLAIGGVAMLVNLCVFLLLRGFEVPVIAAAPAAFVAAAYVNYILCVKLLFNRAARWQARLATAIYIGIVILIGSFDVAITAVLIERGLGDPVSKLVASFLGFPLNFFSRRYLVFEEPSSGDWMPQRTSEPS